METTLSPEYDTSLKRNIEVVFLSICLDVSFLRVYFTTKAPGAVYPRFRQFKEGFDYLFTLSSNKKELNQDIVKRAKEWLDKPSKESKESVFTGIKLFEEYKAELFKQNILKLG